MPEPEPAVAVVRVQLFSVKLAVRVELAASENGPHVPVPEQDADPVDDHPANE